MTRHVTKLANSFAISINGKRLKWIISFSNFLEKLRQIQGTLSSHQVLDSTFGGFGGFENIEANLLIAQYTELAIGFRASDSILIVPNYDGKISARATFQEKLVAV